MPNVPHIFMSFDNNQMEKGVSLFSFLLKRKLMFREVKWPAQVMVTIWTEI